MHLVLCSESSYEETFPISSIISFAVDSIGHGKWSIVILAVFPVRVTDIRGCGNNLISANMPKKKGKDSNKDNDELVKKTIDQQANLIKDHLSKITAEKSVE
uniref:Uncharacterized protein n=1 Tax=Romanomermis culicivorax TaxID=13658 RepID=A0A915JL12_ROMCU